MDKKAETDKVRYVKVVTPMVLNKKVRPAYVGSKYPTLEAAEQSSERGRIMTPLQAFNFMRKWNKKFEPTVNA